MKYTKEDCIAAIQRFYKEEGRVPLQKDFTNNSLYPSAKTTVRRCNGWNNAIELAGFISFNKKWTKEECITAIQNFYYKEGRIPLYKDFACNSLYPGAKTIQKLFGSWNAAIESAGFTPNPSHYETIYNKKICIKAIQNFYKKEGRIPLYKDFECNSLYPSSRTIQRLFDSWNNAIESAGFTPSYSDLYGIPTKAKDEVLYRSIAEARFVDKFLYDKEIYEYETKYPDPHNKYYDFYLPERDIYIEIDGGIRPQVIKEKIEINKRLNRNLLVIKTTDINNFKGFK